jgi:hypothetical protein
MSDERVKATPQVHPASQGIAGTSDDKPAVVRAQAGDEIISHGATMLASTGGNGNPAAPPALLTVIQQSIMSRLSPALICAGSKH